MMPAPPARTRDLDLAGPPAAGFSQEVIVLTEPVQSCRNPRQPAAAGFCRAFFVAAAAAATVALLASFGAATAFAADLKELKQAFAQPPDDARPWVYWTWLSGNLTREGITADLEAMKRVGIGGAIILDVENGTPDGPIKFMDERWQAMFKHTVAEAKRLGMELNMNNGAGYFGSGGDWVPPEKAMQSVIASETRVPGGARFSANLPKPTDRPEYRDIAVMAVAEPAIDPKNRFKIQDFEMKALQWKTWVAYRGTRSAPLDAEAPASAVIAQERVIDLTSKMEPSGKLTWDAPPGEWTVLRFGHAWNGSRIGPVPKGQGGPETDKLDASATRLHFDAFVKRLNDIVGPAGKGTLVATHIDSWEGGGQTWTPAMRAEFQRRRGYDILPWLPVLSGRVLGSLQMTERFLWDLRKTVSELMVENYVREFQQLAKQQGLRFTFEAYTTAGHDFDAANFTDEPTAEFWTPNGQGLDFQPTVKSMSSAAHLNGRKVVGAEAFTSGNREKWLWHPGMIKWIGDRAFSQGANRFVVHRYAAQRFIDPKPGMQMGPWGLHYERTNTWWDWSGPWHAYVTRCQHLLRQGEPVADVLALQPEEPLYRFQPLPLKGFDYDACGPDTFNQVTVRDGKLTLPTGRQYRLLSLTHTGTMTVPILTRIRDLVRAGAAVVGAPPKATPGLTDYPKADAQLAELVAELWGSTSSAGERAVGKGKVFGGMSAEEAMDKLDVQADFSSDQAVHWIHRTIDGAEVYFVANPRDRAVVANCEFRVTGRSPELWNAETGQVRRAALFTGRERSTRIVLPLGPSDSVFVVFPPAADRVEPVASFTRDGAPALGAGDASAGPRVQSASYGPPGDAARTRDVREKVQRLLDQGDAEFPVGRLAEGDDPAWGVVKTLVMEYLLDGRRVQFKGIDTDTFRLKGSTAAAPALLHYGDDGRLTLEARTGGRYEIRHASGSTASADVPALASPHDVAGPWRVRFPSGWGAPPQIELESLASLSSHADAGVKHFSGVATYVKSVNIPQPMLGPGSKLYLHLGDVQVMAKVRLNGKDLGLLWRPPYRLEITPAARAGDNALEVDVVNLWPNRLIGDEHLPEDSDRNRNGTLKSWPQWLLAGKPSPSGRLTFSSWRLWKKEDPLPPSGLIGPVTLEPAHEVRLP